MIEQEKVDWINLALSILVIMSCFFAGYLLKDLFFLSFFLLVGGVILSQVTIVPKEEEKNE